MAEKDSLAKKAPAQTTGSLTSFKTPSITKNNVAQSDVTKPAVDKPSLTKPVEAKPVEAKPVAEKSNANVLEPSTNNPSSNQPSSNQPFENQQEPSIFDQYGKKEEGTQKLEDGLNQPEESEHLKSFEMPADKKKRKKKAKKWMKALDLNTMDPNDDPQFLCCMRLKLHVSLKLFQSLSAYFFNWYILWFSSILFLDGHSWIGCVVPFCLDSGYLPSNLWPLDEATTTIPIQVHHASGWIFHGSFVFDFVHCELDKMQTAL